MNLPTFSTTTRWLFALRGSRGEFGFLTVTPTPVEGLVWACLCVAEDQTRPYVSRRPLPVSKLPALARGIGLGERIVAARAVPADPTVESPDLIGLMIEDARALDLRDELPRTIH
jgi:hypothetical protein